jgi:(2Fe-2S) ferredoxin
MTEAEEYLQNIKTKHGLGQYHRHVFLCTGPRCCTPEEGEAAYSTLKDQIADRGLMSVGPNACFRTKVNCLRVCGHGPVGVVYPEGTWYYGLTADRIPLFVEQHLIQGKPVKEWTFAENPLPNE